MTDDQIRDTVMRIIDALNRRRHTVVGDDYAAYDVVALLHAIRDFMEILADHAEQLEVQP